MKDRLALFVATESRRRMTVIAASTLFFSIASVGNDVLLPLWVTRDLHLTAEDWARLRSLRMVGALIGVVFLGALSDRWGQRLWGALSMLGVAGVLATLALGPPGTLWAAIPVFGALMSTAFVNLNTLTQTVSQRRQGLANTIYRSVGAGASIVAPVTVTLLVSLWGGYRPVFLLSAVLLLVGGATLLLHPRDETPPSLGDWRAELRRLAGSYRVALRQGPLLRVIAVSHLWNNVLAGVGAFSAIWFTQRLDRSDQWFGTVSTLAGALAFLATATAGFYLDRISLRAFAGVGAILAGLCSVLMGVASHPIASAAAFVLFAPLINGQVGPHSMWVSRTAGEGTQTAAFSVHKVSGALLMALTMAMLGALESRIGMRAIFIGGGMLGMVTGALFFTLSDPPSPMDTPRATRPQNPSR